IPSWSTGAVAHGDLPPFPTRRSSDLTGRAGIAELTGGQEPANVESQRFDVAGLEGVEHVAPPKGSGEASDAGIYQVILKGRDGGDRKSTRLNSSHVKISYAVFCLKKQ